MGYDLHIARCKDQSDLGNEITAEQWLAYLKRDPEFRLEPVNGPYFVVWLSSSGESWLDWSNGQIFTKNPEPLLIDKMVMIARELGGIVQGDDGEIYGFAGQPTRRSEPPFAKRMAAWLGWLFPRRRIQIEHESIGFRVGDEVIDPWGNEHTILAIDPRAEHGMGMIRTRRKDGTEHSHLMAAHGFKAKNAGVGR